MEIRIFCKDGEKLVKKAEKAAFLTLAGLFVVYFIALFVFTAFVFDYVTSH